MFKLPKTHHIIMIKHAFELIAVARKLMMVASNVGSYFKKVRLSPNDDAG